MLAMMAIYDDDEGDDDDDDDDCDDDCYYTSDTDGNNSDTHYDDISIRDNSSSMTMVLNSVMTMEVIFGGAGRLSVCLPLSERYVTSLIDSSAFDTHLRQNVCSINSEAGCIGPAPKHPSEITVCQW